MSDENQLHDDDYLMDTPEFGPEQSSTDPVSLENDPAAVDSEPVTTDPEGTEPTTTEPGESVPTGTGDGKEAEADAEPEISDAAMEKIKELEKRLRKSENRQHYLDRQLKARQEKDEAKSADEKFEEQLLIDNPEPNERDFETHSEYEDARIQWKIDIGVARGVHKQAQKAEEHPPAGRKEFMDGVFESGNGKFSDFGELIQKPDLPITFEIIDAIKDMQSDTVDPADVFYYLGKHPAETSKISRMTPQQVERAIDKIELKLSEAKAKAGNEPPATSAEPARNPKSKIKEVSGASTPIKSSDSTVIIHKDPEKMTQAEYEQWRRDQGA